MEKELMFINQTFKYKGYTIDIRCEADDDDRTTLKAYHHVYSDNGDEIIAPISPYDSSQLTVTLWIDCGMPKRQWKNGISSPYSREDLVKLYMEGV